MKAYIISYMPEDEYAYKKRLVIHYSQIDNLLMDGFEIHIISMGKIVDYSRYKTINIIRSIRLNASQARNFCIKLFKQTNDKFCLIADNDSYFRREKCFDKINNIDFDKLPKRVIYFVDGRYIGYNVFNEKYKDDLKANYILKSTTHFKSSLFFYPKEETLLFNENCIESIDDIEFGCRLVEKGTPPLVFYNLNQYSFQGLSTIDRKKSDYIEAKKMKQSVKNKFIKQIFIIEK